MFLRKTILMVCIMLVSAYANAQTITVRGNVSDNTGPLMGVTVLVQGTETLSTTDLDGNYSIQAPANATLSFSSLGYRTVAVPVNGRARINVVMEEEALLLQDLVVVGFGVQKKENLTGAVSSVDIEKTLTARPIADVGRGLQGTTPGLSIVVGSGEVGSDPLIKIRGQYASIQGSSTPLILMDNVEIPSIQMVNPDDIESISVLKDAASASIYGSKAAFGVILITTKKGARTEKVHVTYSGNVAFQNPSKKFVMGGVDALEYTVTAAERIGTTTPVGAFWLIDREGYNKAVAWQQTYGSSVKPGDPMVYGRDWYVNANNQKIGVRTYEPYQYMLSEWAPSHLHNLSVNGKAGRTDFNVSLGFLDQNGMMKTAQHDDFRRWNGSVRLNTQVNKWLKIHAGAMYSKRDQRYAYATNSSTADVWYYMFRWGPTFPWEPEDNGKVTRNPVYETSAANTAHRTTNYTSFNAGLTITPVKNWDILLDYTHANQEYIINTPGYSFTAGNTWSSPIARLNPDGTRMYVNSAGEKVSSSDPGAMPAYQLDYYNYTAPGGNPDHIYRYAENSMRNTVNLTSNYLWEVNENNTLNILAGMSAVTYDEAAHWAQKTTLIDITNPQFSLANGTQTCGGYEAWESQLGFFARLNYNYAEKYLLEANIRYDGTSKFPTHLQWRWYPSFSAGWRVMQEPWMQWAKPVISSLKLRGSWGSIGDQTVSNALYVPTMSSTTSLWLQGGSKMVFYGTPAAVSAAITWQDITSMDFGFDARFFNSALGITFDWFQRDTKNMIVPSEGIPPTYGTGAPRGNFGSLRTRGWEITLDFGHVFSNGLVLNALVTLSDATTKITKYGSTTSIDDWYVGKTYGEIWGYETDRLYQKEDFVYDGTGNLVTITSQDGYVVYQTVDGITQGRLQNSSNFKFGPGDVKFKDQNGDGIINPGSRLTDDHGDLKVIGNSTPRYEYGFRLGAEFRGFDLQVFFQGVGKRELWGNSSMTIAGYNSADGAMAQAIAGDFWREDRTGAFYPRPYNNANSNNTNNMQIQTRYLLDMSYLRMKNLTLGYSLPAQWMRKVNISKLRIYASLENFLTFDNLRGLPIDPEEVAGYSIYNTSNYNSSRTGVGAPTFKTASVGIQINF